MHSFLFAAAFVLMGIGALAAVRPALAGWQRDDQGSNPGGAPAYQTSGLALDGTNGIVYVLTGLFRGAPSTLDWATYKYNSADGTPLDTSIWPKYWGTTSGGDEPHAIATDSAGNIYVAGCEFNGGTGYDVRVLKYDGAGSSLWVPGFGYAGPGGSLDCVFGLTVSGSYIYVVTNSSSPSQILQVHKLKTVDGTEEAGWPISYDGWAAGLGSSVYGYGITVDSSAVYVTGYIEAGASVAQDSFFTLKLNSTTGAIIAPWPKIWTDGLPAKANSIALDTSGNIYVAGGNGSINGLIVHKYLANGTLASSPWPIRYTSGGGGFAYRLLADASGLFVTGFEGSGNGRNFLTRLYNYNAGLVRQYGPPIDRGNVDMSYGLATDSTGVFVTGPSFNARIWTIKYDLASPPTVSTPTKSNIADVSATLGATVDSDGGAALSARGTCWGIVANPTANCAAEGGTTTGVFTHSRTGLSPNTNYYYRGYATNIINPERGYSPDDPFLTLPSISGTPTFTNIQTTSVRINWTAPAGGATSYKIARCQGVGCVPTIDIATGVASLFYDDSGLNPNTTYRYLVRATNATGDGAASGVGTVVTGSANSAPTAIITDWPSTLIIGRTYTLRGNTSFDPEDCPGGDSGGCLTYVWSVVIKPPTSNVVFNGPYSDTQQFIPDVAGAYAIGLRVRDSAGTWSSLTTSASARTLPKWKETKP